MIPLAKRVPQRAKNVFGPGGDKVRLAVGAFARVAALARLFFDIKKSQSTSEMTAITFGNPGAPSCFNHEDAKGTKLDPKCFPGFLVS
jgi:hypothetical protein